MNVHMAGSRMPKDVSLGFFVVDPSLHLTTAATPPAPEGKDYKAAQTPASVGHRLPRTLGGSKK